MSKIKFKSKRRNPKMIFRQIQPPLPAHIPVYSHPKHSRPILLPTFTLPQPQQETI